MFTDAEVLKKYNAMPDLNPTIDRNKEDYFLALFAGSICFLMPIFLFGIVSSQNAHQEQLAGEIVKLQTNDFTCTELKNKIGQLWLNDELPYYKGTIIYDRLVQQGCISENESKVGLNTLFCKIYDTLSCKIDEIKNPKQMVQQYKPRKTVWMIDRMEDQ